MANLPFKRMFDKRRRYASRSIDKQMMVNRWIAVTLVKQSFLHSSVRMRDQRRPSVWYIRAPRNLTIVQDYFLKNPKDLWFSLKKLWHHKIVTIRRHISIQRSGDGVRDRDGNGGAISIETNAFDKLLSDDICFFIKNLLTNKFRPSIFHTPSFDVEAIGYRLTTWRTSV